MSASFARDQDQYLESPPIPSTSKQRLTESAQDRSQSPLLPLAAADDLELNKPRRQRQSVIEYAVAPGDTVAAISQRFGINPQTITWANQIGNGYLISVGDKLQIPPVDGVLHTVAEGDTVASIAKRYGVEVAAIANYEPNQLANPDSLAVGQKIIVPGGEFKPPPVSEPKPAPSSEPKATVSSEPKAPPVAQPKEEKGLAWPTYGMLTQYFSDYHHGIDIAAPMGTPIYAAASGRVIKAEKLDWSYGWHLIIDQGNGFEALYGHCSQFAVGVGDRVERGQIIAYIGSTGKATGPHLHFELTQNGQFVNPLNYLP